MNGVYHMRAGALRRAASSLLTLTFARGFHVRILHLYVCQDQIDRVHACAGPSRSTGSGRGQQSTKAGRPSWRAGKGVVSSACTCMRTIPCVGTRSCLLTRLVHFASIAGEHDLLHRRRSPCKSFHESEHSHTHRVIPHSAFSLPYIPNNVRFSSKQCPTMYWP